MNEPIILFGAGRSGTKMLRGILASHPALVCFPRELNYIWRYGNAFHPNDELKSEHARPQVKRYINRTFEKWSSQNGERRVLEKTCANCLRVGFVRKIFPHAKLIHLIRDGRAVTESAMRMWRSTPPMEYIFEKLRWVPIFDIPYYGLRYLRFQSGRYLSKKRAQSSWGPRFHDIDETVAQRSIVEVCGIQWARSVTSAESVMSQEPKALALSVRYEDIIRNPEETLERIFRFLGLEYLPVCSKYVRMNLNKVHLNKWEERLDEKDLSQLLPHIESNLIKNGYLDRTS
jgi:Sulfotransferase family